MKFFVSIKIQRVDVVVLTVGRTVRSDIYQMVPVSCQAYLIWHLHVLLLMSFKSSFPCLYSSWSNFCFSEWVSYLNLIYVTFLSWQSVSLTYLYWSILSSSYSLSNSPRVIHGIVGTVPF